MKKMRWYVLVLGVFFLFGCNPQSELEQEPLPEINLLWNFDDPAASEQAFRALLPTAKSQGSQDYLLQLQTQIARSQGLQQKFGEAHATLDVVERALGTASTLTRIRYLLERGRVLNSSGEADSSYALFKDAWELGLQSGEDFYTVDAAHMLGIVTPPVDALRWNEKALEIAEKSNNPRARNWLGSLYNNIGWTYFGIGDDSTALALFEKALAWRIEMKQEREIEIAQWCVARTLRSMGKIEESLAMQQQIEKDIAAAGRAPDGYVAEEIGECLLALGRVTEAKPHFRQAYDLLSQDIWMQRNEAERLERLRALGN